MRSLRNIVLGIVAALVAMAAVCASTDRRDRFGAIVRHNADSAVIYLIFSADSMFEGAPAALSVLDARGIKASFFLTGNFIRRHQNSALIHRILNSGHYIGGHSDRHILWADWNDERTPLVTEDSMLADVRGNLAALDSMGIPANDCRWFLPPFEWIGPGQAATLTDSLGIKIINPTPGIQIYRDYTTPDMTEYHSSDSILRQLYDYERRKGLNGALLIMHLGTQEARTDKLYYHLPEIIDSLSALGYTFGRLD